MSEILVIGKSGQMAQALAHAGAAGLHCAGREEADLLNANAVAAALDVHTPRIVINAGAYTAVDKAESEPALCRALNVDAPTALAKLCHERGIPLVHLSTDCVFDGEKSTPYLAQDATCPVGVYGQSKLDGELAVRSAAPSSLVVRVSWIFSHFGSNFVTTMLRLATTRDEVSVVDDQYGCPTHAPALAEALLQIADKAGRPGFGDWGTYHLAGSGEADRASMARRIFEASARHGGPMAKVKGIPTSDYPTPTRRPLNARLDMSDTTRVFGTALPVWTEGLEDTVRVLVRELRSS
ncbi:MAG: dTDP-4-dehydrorhamnose reductase [Hyphomonas sp.]|uniref:dTDP-4-dehydrorhamnose reductase n=1 Tax=Hyphomonas sp. TaxID=87 RepID=UPI00326534BE